MHPRPKAVDRSYARYVPAHHTAYRHTGVFDGAELTVLYAVDDREHCRRESRGIGAITDEAVLAALVNVPTSKLVRVSRRFWTAFDRPHGQDLAVVISDPDGVLWAQRKLSTPVAVIHIEIGSADLESGITSAHRWVGYGPRTVRVGRSPNDESLSKARQYGIGVLTNGSDRPVLEPAQFDSRRWTSARWRFSELVYELYLQSASMTTAS